MTDYANPQIDACLFRPRRKEGLKLIGPTETGNLVFLDPLGPNWVPLTPSASMVLSFCDGTRSVGEIAQVFRSTNLEASSSTFVFNTATMLSELGMFEDEGRNASYQKESNKLRELFLYATRRCNLRCAHCYFHGGNPLHEELTTDEIFDLTNDCADAGIDRITFFGGEPLMRPDIFVIAQRIRDHGMKAALYTNGTKIDRNTSRKIAENFNGVAVSLDGLERENDVLRGSGSFQETIQGIKSLLKTGVPLMVSTVVNSINIQSLHRLFEFLAGFGVRKFQCLGFRRIGRGENTHVRNVSRLELCRVLSSLTRKFPELTIISDCLGLLQAPLKFERRRNCGVCHGNLVVDPEGETFACSALMHKGPTLGNIRNLNVSEIYWRSPALLELRNIDVDEDDYCRSCIYRYLCGGRCLAEPRQFVDGECESAELFEWLLTRPEDVRTTTRL